MTHSGLYVGQGATYHVDLRRLDRVVARTIKGLFYQKKRARLPDEYEVTVWSESGLAHLPKEQLAEVRTKLVDPLLAVAPETIGQNVFSYRVAFDADDPNISGWLLVFYEHIRFVGMSVKEPSRSANPS